MMGAFLPKQTQLGCYLLLEISQPFKKWHSKGPVDWEIGLPAY